MVAGAHGVQEAGESVFQLEGLREGGGDEAEGGAHGAGGAEVD